MGKFRIMPHGRLQEWVAEEHGYFTAEGLDYEFVYDFSTDTPRASNGAEPSEVKEIRQGAFESMQEGRACEVSSACHWAVNMAASAQHGRMWGHAYAVAPSGIYVPPESPIRKASELANVEVAVGIARQSFFRPANPENVYSRQRSTCTLLVVPVQRLGLLLNRNVAWLPMSSGYRCMLEQQGFRKVVDTTFMIGFGQYGGARRERAPLLQGFAASATRH